MDQSAKRSTKGRSLSQDAVASLEKKPWVKPLLVREPVQNTATNLGTGGFDGSFNS